jgi:hypothetical protein
MKYIEELKFSHDFCIDHNEEYEGREQMMRGRVRLWKVARTGGRGRAR